MHPCLDAPLKAFTRRLGALGHLRCSSKAGVEILPADADAATADDEINKDSVLRENTWPCDFDEEMKWGCAKLRQGSVQDDASTTCSSMSLESASEGDDQVIESDCGSAEVLVSQRWAAGQSSDLTIRTCSWNLNGKTVDGQEDLSRWLEGCLADVLVVGVQELIELEPKSVLHSWSNNRIGRAAFEEHLENAISRQGSYKRVCSYGMVGLAIFVYVREDLVPLIGDLQMKSVKTGFQGTLGNKGAVSVRIRIGSFNACFVNVHLASGTGKAMKREKHLSKIIAQSVNRGIQDRAGCFAGIGSAGTTGGCHFTAILGDFNSRLELGRQAPLAKGCEGVATAGGCPSGAPLEEWLRRDEMVNRRLESLRGFSEGPLTFAPTFGYVPGSNVFGRRYHPAWTDRVVYRAAGGARAELQEYDAFLDVRRTSDHRPVAAQFRVSLGR